MLSNYSIGLQAPGFGKFDNFHQYLNVRLSLWQGWEGARAGLRCVHVSLCDVPLAGDGTLSLALDALECNV